MNSPESILTSQFVATVRANSVIYFLKRWIVEMLELASSRMSEASRQDSVLHRYIGGIFGEVIRNWEQLLSTTTYSTSQSGKMYSTSQPGKMYSTSQSDKMYSTPQATKKYSIPQSICKLYSFGGYITLFLRYYLQPDEQLRMSADQWEVFSRKYQLEKLSEVINKIGSVFT